MKAKIVLVKIVVHAPFFILKTTTTLTPKGETFERKLIFEWLGMPASYVIMRDDNPDFTTPATEKFEGKAYTLEKDLGLGTYYWEVKRFRNSKVQKFTIASKASLKREDDESLKNDGNTRLKLGIRSGITGAATLGINQTIVLGKEAEEVTAKLDE